MQQPQNVEKVISYNTYVTSSHYIRIDKCYAIVVCIKNKIE